MVTIMNMNTGEVIRAHEADHHDEALISAERPRLPEPGLQLQEHAYDNRAATRALSAAARFLSAHY
jgi:hypothetical protein